MNDLSYTKTKTMIEYKELQYGFKYGNATIQRIASDKNKGWVILELQTSKQRFQIYVTKTGKVRILDFNGNELKQKQ